MLRQKLENVIVVACSGIAPSESGVHRGRKTT